MTRMEQLQSPARDRPDDAEIVSHDGRRNASTNAEPATLQQQIEVLFETGLSDIEIAERLGCKTPYVRVARQRAGLFRAPAGVPKGRHTEARMVRRIDALQEKLTAAWLDLRKWRENQLSK